MNDWCLTVGHVWVRAGESDGTVEDRTIWGPWTCFRCGCVKENR